MKTTSNCEIGGLLSSTPPHGVEKQVLRLADVIAVQVNSVAGAASEIFDPALTSACVRVVRDVFRPHRVGVSTLRREWSGQ
jgi:hypothetical protein